MTLNDLELLPPSPQKRFFGEFFLISVCDTEFKSKFHRNGWR